MAAELIFRIRPEAGDFKSTMAQVRSELTQTSQSQKTVNQGELSMRQQLAAVSSLQRQRSAALIGEWKRTEKAAADLARGVGPVKDNLQKITDVMQTLGASSSALQGPMNGISGRLRALGFIAAETGGGLGVAAAGIAAVVVTAAAAIVTIVKLNQEAFEAAKAWSAYGQEIYKAKLITGQTAEQLSVLKVIASETDTPFETLSRTAAKLQVAISKGITEPSGEAGRALKFLGLSTEAFKKSTPDQQLQATAKALNAVTNQSDKNRASMALLSRGYTESAEALHDIGERYDDTRERAAALGLIMSEEAVEAAHQFDDAMDEVKTGLIALTVQAGQRTAPIILAALDDIARSLGLNQNSWKAWGALIGDVLAATVTGTVRAAREITAAIRLIPLATLGGPLGTVEAIRQLAGLDAAEQAKQVAALRAGQDVGIGASVGTGAGRGGGGSFPGGGGKKAAKEKLSEAQRLLNQLQDEHNRLTAKANDLTKVQIVAQELLDTKYKGLTATMRDQILTEAAQIDRVKEKIDLDKRKEQATEKIRAVLERQNETIKDARDGDDQWADEIVKLEAELKKLGLTMDANTKKLLTDNAATQKALSLTRERIALEETRIKRMERERVVTDEQRARQVGVDLSRGDEERQRRALEPVIENRSAIDQLFGAINDNLTESTQTAALAGLNAITEGFGAMAQAVGAAAQAWIFYGSAGTSVRQVTAQVLASITQMAIAKAAFEVAEGFAMLAAAFFGIPMAGPSAAMHFKAAAMYGLVAGGAALAGRVAAGNSFNGSGGAASSAFQSATGGRSGPSGGGQSGSGSPITLESQRGAIVEHRVIISAERGFIAKEMVKELSGNGAVREHIAKEIDRQR